MFKTTLTLSIVALTISLSSLAFAAEAQTTFDKELSVGNIRYFTLTNSNGDVEILPSSDNRITIHATKKIIGPVSDLCDNYLNELQIHVVNSASGIDIKSSQFNRSDYDGSIEYSITVPDEVQLKVTSVSGNIVCRDRKADIQFQTTNGDIELANCFGKLTTTTMNGNITIDGATSDATIRTTNGELNLYLALDDNGRIKAKTENGSIHLQLPDNVSSMVSARTDYGTVSSGYFGSSLSINPRQTYASGRLGNGDGTILVETRSGSIYLDTYDQNRSTVASNKTVIVHTERPIVEERVVRIIDRPCYPPFHHFRHPWRPASISFPLFRIVLGDRHPHHPAPFVFNSHRDRPERHDNDRGRAGSHDNDRRRRDDDRRHR